MAVNTVHKQILKFHRVGGQLGKKMSKNAP